MTERGDGKTTEAMNVVRDEALELRSYRLTVVEGPDAGASLPLDVASPTRVLVGQSKACQLVLSDRQVSRRHVGADLHHGSVKIVDLGSKNGTRVNGVRVFEAIVEPGDRIALGGTTLRVDLADAPHEPANMTPNVNFGRIVGASVAMRRLYPLCERLAASDLPAVIEGETGVGKELLAEAIHEAGPRKAKPFVVFDCAANEDVNATLEQANGGTLLLDEIAELDDDAQARMLRLVDRKDVRLLATSRRDLDKAVQGGRFREELFFRLAVSRIELPPLRERDGDVPLLARTFWKTMSGQRTFPDALLDRYEGYTWPGNVRELRNVVARRLTLGAFGDSGVHRPSAAPDVASQSDVIERVLAMDLPLVEARGRVVSEFEARYLAKVLERHGGNVSRAAAASGIARRYFQVLRARTGEKK
jgi:DNA-binding NtrC family response regulator